jgi:hypothetical protein
VGTRPFGGEAAIFAFEDGDEALDRGKTEENGAEEVAWETPAYPGFAMGGMYRRATSIIVVLWNP